MHVQTLISPLVYPPYPGQAILMSGKPVLVVCGDDASPLPGQVQECLQNSGTTVQVTRLDDLQSVSDYDLVLATQMDVKTANRINIMARDSLTPFLYCQMIPQFCVLFYDQGELNSELGGPSRADGLAVHVGAVIRGDGSSVISCDRAHSLRVGDKLMVGCGEVLVVEVMSDKVVKVEHDDIELHQGDLVLPTPSLISGHRPLSFCLDDQNSLHSFLCLQAEQCHGPCGGQDIVASLPAVFSSAGLIAGTIIAALTKRFPLENSLQFFPIPSSTNLESSKLIQEKSLIVFGCGELSVELIRSLVMMRFKLVTVLCQFEEQARLVEKLADSLDKKFTEIVTSLLDPGSQPHVLWSQADCVICAGGRTDERLPVHSWCVQYSRPGIDMAVEGRLGQVETMLPHQTASYSCTPSPPDQEPPFCVTKSFPHLPEHSAVWAKQKITNLLHAKPKICHQFLADPNLTQVSIQSAVSYKLMSMFGQKPTWHKCLQIARTKFNKYFVAKALQLQSSFSSDSTVSSGDHFWAWPKMFPKPLVFSTTNPDHMEFVGLLAVGLARVVGVQEGKFEGEEIIKMLEGMTVPSFMPKNKEIITDESIASDNVTDAHGEIDLSKLSSLLNSSTLHVDEADLPQSKVTRLSVLASHLRCDMYNIPRATDEQMMYFMGYLEPCLSSTVHQVVGIGLGELVKIFSSSSGCSSSSNSSAPTNWWVGPGLVTASAAVKPALTKLSPGLSVTLWDKLEIQGDSSTTLQDFLHMMQQKYQLEVTMVVQDSRMVYVPFMPGHKGRLPKRMSNLVKNIDSTGAVTLSVTAAGEQDEEDLTVPPVRFFLK